MSDYTNLISALGNWLQRAYLAFQLPNFVVLFEAVANRRLRVRQQEATAALTPSNGVVALPSDYLNWRRLTWTGNPRQELGYVEPSWLQGASPDLPTDIPRDFP